MLSKLAYEFRGLEVELEVVEYTNGNTCLRMFDEEAPYMTISVNIDKCLNDNVIIVKNYSENKGVLNFLLDNDLVKLTGVQVDIGYNTCEVAIINKEKFED